MKTVQKTLRLSTTKRCEMLDITRQAAEFVSESAVSMGQINIYCPHTTAAITINENADPDVVSDILVTLDKLVPRVSSRYRHAEGNSDAHVKSSVLGTGQCVLIDGSRLVLGTWQGIYFCEFDGPRNRKVVLQVVGQ